MDELRVALKNGKIVNFSPDALDEDSYGFLQNNAVHPDIAFTAKNGKTVKMSLTDGWDESMPSNLKSMFADGWTKEAINANKKHDQNVELEQAKREIKSNIWDPGRQPQQIKASSIHPIEPEPSWSDKLTGFVLDTLGPTGGPVSGNQKTKDLGFIPAIGRAEVGYAQQFIEFAKNIGKGAAAYNPSMSDMLATPKQRVKNEAINKKQEEATFGKAIKAIKDVGAQYFGKEDLATSGGKFYFDIQVMNGLGKIFHSGATGPIAWVTERMGRPLTAIETKLVEGAVKVASGAKTGAAYGGFRTGEVKGAVEDAALFAAFEAAGPAWGIAKEAKNKLKDAYWAWREPGVAEFFKSAREIFTNMTDAEIRGGIDALRARAKKEGRPLKDILDAERIKFERMNEPAEAPAKPQLALPAGPPELPRFVASEDGTLEDLKNPAIFSGPPNKPEGYERPLLQLPATKERLQVNGQGDLVDVTDPHDLPRYGPFKSYTKPGTLSTPIDPAAITDATAAGKKVGFPPINEEEAKIPDVLWSDSGKAKYTYQKEGEAIIEAMSDASFDDFMHEVGHVWRRSLKGKALARIEKEYKVVGGKWTREQEEAFARDLKKYVDHSKNLKNEGRIGGMVTNISRFYNDLFAKVGIDHESKAGPKIRVPDKPPIHLDYDGNPVDDLSKIYHKNVPDTFIAARLEDGTIYTKDFFNERGVNLHKKYPNAEHGYLHKGKFVNEDHYIEGEDTEKLLNKKDFIHPEANFYSIWSRAENSPEGSPERKISREISDIVDRYTEAMERLDQKEVVTPKKWVTGELSPENQKDANYQFYKMEYIQNMQARHRALKRFTESLRKLNIPEHPTLKAMDNADRYSTIEPERINIIDERPKDFKYPDFDVHELIAKDKFGDGEKWSRPQYNIKGTIFDRSSYMSAHESGLLFDEWRKRAENLVEKMKNERPDLKLDFDPDEWDRNKFVKLVTGYPGKMTIDDLRVPFIGEDGIRRPFNWEGLEVVDDINPIDEFPTTKSRYSKPYNPQVRWSGSRMDSGIDDLGSLNEAPYSLNSDSGKAKITFINKGKSIISAMDDATFNDFMHETGHLWRKSLTGKELAAAEKKYGVFRGNWTREQEEAFARDFAKYIHTGEGGGLKEAFDSFLARMGYTWESGNNEPTNINKYKLGSMFDQWVAHAQELENTMKNSGLKLDDNPMQWDKEEFIKAFKDDPQAKLEDMTFPFRDENNNLRFFNWDGSEYVDELSPSLKKIGDVPYYSLNSDTGRANITFQEKGKSIIRAMKSATYNDFIHELGHVWRDAMTGTELAEAEKAYGVISGKWTRKNEEDFARDFRDYIQGSRRGSEGLHQAFDSVLSLIGNTYKGFRTSPEAKDMAPEVKDFVSGAMKTGTGLNAMLKGGSSYKSSKSVGSVELHSGGGPSWDKVKTATVERQIKPAVEGLNGVWESVLNTVAPQGKSADAYKVSLDIREGLGIKEHDMALSRHGLLGGDDFVTRTIKRAKGQKPLLVVRDVIDKLSDMDIEAFKNNLETGKKQATPALQNASDKLREVLDRLESRLMSLPDTEKLNFIENYFPHILDVPKAERDYLIRNFARNPADGIKNFLKPRKFKTLVEAKKEGYKELFRNPVDSVLAKAEEVERFYFGRSLRSKGINEGWIKKIMHGKGEVPEGWVNADDVFGKIYAPNEIEVSGRGRRNLLKAAGETTTTNVFGRTEIGNYWIQPDVAQVVRNHFKPGLGKSATFEKIREWTNTLNQTTLGISGFHAQMTSVQSMMSSTALALQYASKGMGKDAIKKIFDSIPVYNQLRNFKLGYGVKWSYINGAGPEELNEIVKLVKLANGRVGQDTAYTNQMIKKFKEAVRAQDIIGSARSIIPAAAEWTAKPLMEKLVPIQKLGIFADMVNYELSVAKKNGVEVTYGMMKKIASEAWNSVDNRMGQVIKDNLFWDRTLNDLAQVIIRSPSWNVGTYREIGGGIKDLFTETYNAAHGKGFNLSHRSAYVGSMILITGFLGAVTTYLHTGHGPEETKDYLYPPTGELNANGTKRRINPVGYAKDVAALYYDGKNMLHGDNKGFLNYFGSKMSPLLSEVIAAFGTGQDYLGTEITHPGDPIVKRTLDKTKFLVKSNIPFSVTNYQRNAKAGESGFKQFTSFLGVSPASRSSMNDDAWNKLDEIRNRKGHPQKTQADVDKYEEIGRLRNLMKQGKNITKDFKEGQRKGIFKLTDSINKTIKPSAKPMIQAMKDGKFTFHDMAEVYQVATDKEKDLLWPTVKAQWFRELGKLSKESPVFEENMRIYKKLRTERH